MPSGPSPCTTCPLLPGRQPDRPLLNRRPHTRPAPRRRRVAHHRYPARPASRHQQLATCPRQCRRPCGRVPSRSAARRGEGHRVIRQNDARDPLIPRTRDARISASPGASTARERSASGPACVCTSPGRPATDTCLRSHRSSADNGRRWACALLHDSAAGVPRIRFPVSTRGTAGITGSPRPALARIFTRGDHPTG